MTHFADGERTRAPEKLSRLQKLGVLITGITLPRPRSTETPDAFQPPYISQTIPTPDGCGLSLWLTPPSPIFPHKGAVLLLHGYGSDKSSMLDEARAFQSFGYLTCLLDFRGSWESSESYTTIGAHEAIDVAAAYRHIKTIVPDQPVIVYGQSMGAAAVLRAMALHDIQADAIILDAVFDSLLETVRNRFVLMGVPSWPAAELLTFWGGAQYGFNGFAHNPRDFAKSVTCPTLMLHGDADPRARLIDAERVYAALPGTNKLLVVFPGLKHVAPLAGQPELWKSAVSNFLGK